MIISIQRAAVQPPHLSPPLPHNFIRTTPQLKTSLSLRQAGQCRALPEISDSIMTQSAAIGHAIKTLALCGFCMIGIDASTTLLEKKTGNDKINLVATSLAAILIGAVIRAELHDMQQVIRTSRLPSIDNLPAQVQNTNQTASSAALSEHVINAPSQKKGL